MMTFEVDPSKSLPLLTVALQTSHFKSVAISEHIAENQACFRFVEQCRPILVFIVSPFGLITILISGRSSGLPVNYSACASQYFVLTYYLADNGRAKHATLYRPYRD